MSPHEAIPSWSVVALATAGVIIRPFRLPEAVWALAGVGALLLLGLLPIDDVVKDAPMFCFEMPAVPDI